MSSLPFLKKKQYSSGGLTTEYSGPEQPKQEQEDTKDEDLRHCAAALIHCMKTGDTAGVARALREAHEICDLYAHEEGPHTNEGEDQY